MKPTPARATDCSDPTPSVRRLEEQNCPDLSTFPLAQDEMVVGAVASARLDFEDFMAGDRERTHCDRRRPVTGAVRSRAPRVIPIWPRPDARTWTLSISPEKKGNPVLIGLSGALRGIVERRLKARRLGCDLIFHRDSRAMAPPLVRRKRRQQRITGSTGTICVWEGA